MTKAFALTLILILATSSLMMTESASAQSIFKPSVPEFTAKYVDHSYETQPTYGYDEYTGKNVITEPSEHVDNRTIEIKIKNQPFTPFTDQNGNNINLLYNVRYKGSFGQEWSLMFGERAEWAGGAVDPYGTYGFPTQDASAQYTTISYSLPWNMVEGQMDIQVEALVGYTNRTVDQSRAHILWSVYIYTFYGEESGWSNTQTVKLGESGSILTPSPSSSNPTTTLTLTPTITSSPGNPISVPLSTLIAVVAAFSAVIVALLLMLYRKQGKNISQNKSGI